MQPISLETTEFHHDVGSLIFTPLDGHTRLQMSGLKGQKVDADCRVTQEVGSLGGSFFSSYCTDWSHNLVLHKFLGNCKHGFCVQTRLVRARLL
jgi:hypothetical protein